MAYLLLVSLVLPLSTSSLKRQTSTFESDRQTNLAYPMIRHPAVLPISSLLDLYYSRSPEVR